MLGNFVLEFSRTLAPYLTLGGPRPSTGDWGVFGVEDSRDWLLSLGLECFAIMFWTSSDFQGTGIVSEGSGAPRRNKSLRVAPREEERFEEIFWFLFLRSILGVSSTTEEYEGAFSAGIISDFLGAWENKAILSSYG